MQVHRGIIGVALVATLGVISLSPLGLSFPLYIALVLAASMLAGVLIGHRSAVYVALGSMIVIGPLYEVAAEYLFRVERHTHQGLRIAAFFVVYALLAAVAAAFGVWLRLRRAGPAQPLGSN